MKKKINKVLLETEKILSNGKKNNTYKKLSKIYEEYKNDEYHDSITDNLYIEKIERLNYKYNHKKSILLFNLSIIVLTILVIISGYFISNYYYKVNNIGNGLIENKNDYLVISYDNLENMMLTKEKSTIGINILSKSKYIMSYEIYAVTDEVTNLNYEVLASSLLYGTNVLKSKRQLIYSGTINPGESKKIEIDLWQNESYNLNSQMRFYVDGEIIK